MKKSLAVALISKVPLSVGFDEMVSGEIPEYKSNSIRYISQSSP